MLANAADADCDTEMRTAFIAILGEVTSLDVVILSMLQSAVPSDDAHGHMPTWNLPEKASSDRDKRRPTGAVALSLANLVRLGCILPFADYGGPLTTAFVSMTGPGRAFVAACTHSHPDNQRPHERP